LHLYLKLSEMPSRTNWPGRPMKMEYLAQHYLLVEEEEEEEAEEQVEEGTGMEEEVEEVEKDEGSSRSRRLNTVSTAT